jgi:hypothetical protein
MGTEMCPENMEVSKRTMFCDKTTSDWRVRWRIHAVHLLELVVNLHF